MTRGLSILLTLPLLLAGCSTATPLKRDCSVVPTALSKTFGSDEGYLLYAKTARRPVNIDNAQKIALATEYLNRPDTTQAGRLHFLQSRARAYAANEDRDLALTDYKTLAVLPYISAERGRYFRNLVKTGDFPTGPRLSPLPANVKDAIPIVRVPPTLPKSVLNRDKSGHCAVQFDVHPTGKIIDLTTEYCTHIDLAAPSLKSVSLWKYEPKTIDGQAVLREGIKTRISFNLQDQCGFLFPE